MAASATPLELMGAAGSPYTRKVIAALRYRHIPYALHWGSHRSPMPGFPEAKVKLLPTVYFPQAGGGYEAQVDSTPILARLEREFSGDLLLVTQNVDDLHERGGSTAPRHMHGELLKAVCLHCRSVVEVIVQMIGPAPKRKNANAATAPDGRASVATMVSAASTETAGPS